ncbi:MAG: hypothetical protein GVY08_10230 [Bacteroidetes bacterium]|jgi:signal transduction histidine kinase|nr:hypothetical protein [Bacteroidota bacterium]
MKYWEIYKQHVLTQCIEPGIEETNLFYWRNSLFAMTVQYLLPLSVIAFVPGVYMAVVTDMTLLLITDLLAALTMIAIAFLPGLSLQFRKILLTFSLYMVSVVLLYELGMYGPGLLYLLVITIFAALIFEYRYALATVVGNLLICVAFGGLIYLDWGSSQVVVQYNMDSWIAVSSNLLFLCTVSLLLIPQLFDGLQRAFDRRKAVEEELKENQQALKISLEQLEEKNEELEKFAYIASHDLKEPLRMVQNFMYLLQKKYSEHLDKKANKYIHFAVDGAKRMTRLINDLLEYSRVGRVHTEKTEVDLNEVVDAIRRDFFEEGDESSDVIHANDLPVIEAVEVSAKMLFQNLVSNGIKYRDESRPPKIFISYEDLQTHWKFSVKDNGIGIHPEYSDRIFDIFKRLHAESDYSGTGIGLAICKKIVEQHDGEIWVESEPGAGSTFYFTMKKEWS